MRAAAKKLGLVLAAAIAALSAADHARADVIHAGVPIDSLALPGLVRARVVTPPDARTPVRVVFAPTAQARPELVVDVLVLETATAARAAYDAQARTRASRTLSAIPGLGDAAVGAGRLALFVRDNVVVAVLGTRVDSDVLDAARTLDAAVRAAPAGSPTASAVTPRWDERALTQQGATTLALGGDVVASEVEVASGPARVRRLSDGWLLMRSAPGAFVLSIVTVDSRLRVAVR